MPTRDWPASGECDGSTWVIRSGPEAADMVDLLVVWVTTANGDGLRGPKYKITGCYAVQIGWCRMAVVIAVELMLLRALLYCACGCIEFLSKPSCISSVGRDGAHQRLTGGSAGGLGDLYAWLMGC